MTIGRDRIFSGDGDVALCCDFYSLFWGGGEPVVSAAISPARAEGVQGIIRSKTSTKFLSIQFVVIEGRST